jgi:hypothetical protein
MKDAARVGVPHGKAALLCLGIVFLSAGSAFSSWPEFALSTRCFSGSAYGTQASPAVAFDGTNFLVVWEDERINNGRDIFGTRVSAQGEILDPIGIPISTASNMQVSAKVAWGGQNYLVVWADYRNGNYDVYGARVSPAGTVLDPDGFPISTGPGSKAFPDLSWDGTNFLVVWSDDRNEYTSNDIYGARVTPAGQVIDGSGIRISSASLSDINPSISYNGTEYLVAWEQSGG